MRLCWQQRLLSLNDLLFELQFVILDLPPIIENKAHLAAAFYNDHEPALYTRAIIMMYVFQTFRVSKRA